jgi:hypothetical protein
LVHFEHWEILWCGFVNTFHFMVCGPHACALYKNINCLWSLLIVLFCTEKKCVRVCWIITLLNGWVHALLQKLVLFPFIFLFLPFSFSEKLIWLWMYLYFANVTARDIYTTIFLLALI